MQCILSKERREEWLLYLINLSTLQKRRKLLTTRADTVCHGHGANWRSRINFSKYTVDAPNEDCHNFFKHIASLLAGNAKGINIVARDFNCVLNSKLEEKFGLIDAWHFHHPRQKDFTFRSGIHGSYSWIDFFCISKQDIYKVESCNIESVNLSISGHGPVNLPLTLGANKIFKYWQLNVSMLSDPLIWERISRERVRELF